MKKVYPKPRSEDEFEDLVTDLYRRELHCSNLQRYSRKGQSQNGVDSAGIDKGEVIGIQSKNFALSNKITEKEIEAEIEKAKKFKPKLCRYIIATSADTDGAIQSYVLGKSTVHEAAGIFSVEIVFWEHIIGMLKYHQDVFYEYILKNLELDDFRQLTLSSPSAKNFSVSWQFGVDDLEKMIKENLDGLGQVDPYVPYVGFSTFKNALEDANLDIKLDVSPQNNHFDDIYNELDKIEKTLSRTNSISKTFLLKMKSRLAYAFLFGWTFRRVKGYSFYPQLPDGKFWTTDGLPLVPSEIDLSVPFIGSEKTDGIAIVLNISRSIEKSVYDHLSKTKEVRAAVSYHLRGGFVSDAAHAQSIAIDIAQKMKLLMDDTNIKTVHLYAALPAPLAAMIGNKLNAIKPIKIYFMDEERENYKLAGEINNNL